MRECGIEIWGYWLIGLMVAWLLLLGVVSIVQLMCRYINDDTSQMHNVVIRYFMEKWGGSVDLDYGYRLNGVGSDGSDITMYGFLIIIVGVFAAALLVYLPLVFFSIVAIFVGVKGARYVTRLSKKIKLLENS